MMGSEGRLVRGMGNMEGRSSGDGMGNWVG